MHPSIAASAEVDQAADMRFRRLYADHGRALFAYALRRTDSPDDAAEVLSDTFLVAWRRLQDVPSGDAARLWLYGVARRTLANRRRGDDRRDRLGQRLRVELAGTLDHHPAPSADALELRDALAQLVPLDQELLRLTAWEGLSHREAASVLGISSLAARSRIHRARRRLRDLLDHASESTHRPSHLEPEEGR